MQFPEEYEEAKKKQEEKGVDEKEVKSNGNEKQADIDHGKVNSESGGSKDDVKKVNGVIGGKNAAAAAAAADVKVNGEGVSNGETEAEGPVAARSVSEDGLTMDFTGPEFAKVSLRNDGPLVS